MADSIPTVTVTTNGLHPKVAFAGLSAAVMTILLWGLSTYAKVSLPPEVAAALTGIVGTVVGYVAPAGTQS